MSDRCPASWSFLQLHHWQDGTCTFCGAASTFVCARCGQTRERGSVKEAEAEALKLFDVSHASTNEQMAEICDACFSEGKDLGLW